MKTPPTHSQSNGLVERIIQIANKTVGMWDKGKETFDTFMARFILNFRSIPHFGKSQSPSQLVGCQICCPITCKYPYSISCLVCSYIACTKGRRYINRTNMKQQGAYLKK